MKLCDIGKGAEAGFTWTCRECVVGCVAFLWAFFQLFVASPIPFWLASQYGISAFVLTGLKTRAVHLSFALLLLYLVMPAVRGRGKGGASPLDWVFSLLGSGAAAYIIVFYDDLSVRMAMPTTADVVASMLGILLLLEAARRAIGFPIIVVATAFLAYSVFGPFMPDVIAHRGHGIASISSHEWLSSEGVFGVALGVSCNFVFLYVLFGALMDRAGAGGFFIRLSFALLRGAVGGPAKAAVVASGFMGMMSGSSVANTITIGSFTIPLMKKMGMSPEKAAAVEVSAGINGQVTPPVMGAAAFLMAEFLALPYSDVVKHALIPAAMVYVGLLVIVHLEACRLNHQGQSTEGRTGGRRMLPSVITLLKFAICAASVALLFGASFVVINGVNVWGLYIPGVKAIFREGGVYFVALVLALVYVALLLCRGDVSKDGAAEDLDFSENGDSSAWHIARQGMHYFMPVFILVWSLVVERVSTSLACFWTNMFLVFMLLTEGVVSSLRARDFSGVLPAICSGLKKVGAAMIASSNNMLAVAVATATAGLVVGTVGLTGFGLTIGSLVDALAGGDMFVALLVTALICIVLGMGMPTTGCYIVVSTLVAPVLSMVAHKNGLTAPPIALHLFVFYFGLMADVTPPVGIASYAAAAIASANSFKTGVQSFLYNIKTMVIPFMFIFDSNIILYGVENVWTAAARIALAFVSVVVLCAGMQGYFIRRNRVYESVILVCAGLMLMMPNYLARLLGNDSVKLPLAEINSRIVTVEKGDRVLVNYERAIASDGKSDGAGYVIVPMDGEFVGNVSEMMNEKVGVAVTSVPVEGKLLVSNVSSDGYVFADIWQGDFITGLSISRGDCGGNYVMALSALIVVVIALLQARSRKLQCV
ncbi:putative transporter [Anaplasma centrale str. Israel]|uniref:Putative transporter n=1 Tax=Anaplasma centrale (strain Israel) TaxID=574556 RepID=D1ASY2_ANACI|nr:TRAP transporter fused permease subunit [Anaplasma centrale]ACZ49585.1 putative transporter [Anaplasma centrale str. Israel]